MEFAIVVVGYNRPNSLNRLLMSLNNSFIDEKIPLIISLDYCKDDGCRVIAEGFTWKYGEKKVVTHDESLGLKSHILECGGYAEKYGNILLLEDDLYVSPFFFPFIKETIKKYSDDDRIAGIGLYNYSINRSTPYRFEAVNDGYDVYFMKSPCSLGQVWSSSKWHEFYLWYTENDEPFTHAKDVPQCVSNWDERSWLKYYVRYCVENNLYFVYPRISLVTDFSDKGNHATESSNEFQIPILMGEKTWRLPNFEDAVYIYDAFYENEDLYRVLNIKKEDLLVDFYGVRESDVAGYSYWLSTKPAKYNILKRYGLLMRPRDLNVILDIPGNDIFLYDLNKPDAQPNDFKFKELVYHIGSVNTRELLEYSIYNTFIRIKKKCKMILKR